jgi:hypothetical protein
MTISNKQAALDLFEDKRREFLDLCRWVADRIYQEKGNVTIDDVRAEVKLPLGIDGRVFGAVFNKSDWEKVGYTQTNTATSHGRPIGVFVRKSYPKNLKIETKMFAQGLF